MALSPDVTRDDVETAAWDLNLFVSHRVPATADQPREDVWRTIDERTWLHEIEDHITGLRYLVVRGADVDRYVRKIRQQLPTVTHTDALRALTAAATPDAKLLALYQLGVAAPPRANRLVVAALTRALGEEPDDGLRQAAVIAIAYTGWPEFADVVRRAAETDPSERVRSTARGLLTQLR